MSNLTEQLSDLFKRVNSLQARLIGLSPDPNLLAATGERISWGCKVTQGEDDEDRAISLQGLAPGDEAHWNPYYNESLAYPFEYPNVAFIKSGGFFFTDLEAEVALPPGAGLGRYDIAYIFLGPTGPGFAVATGTPGAGVKTDYDLNGLKTDFYNPLTDVAIPVGAFPVARIYVESVFPYVLDAQIADIRSFYGFLDQAYQNILNSIEELLPIADDLAALAPVADEIAELGGSVANIDALGSIANDLEALADNLPELDQAVQIILNDNEQFKKEMRTLFWLGV